MPGSWAKRGKDSYRLQVSMGTDFKGDPIRYTKTVHCKSDTQADKELAKFYAECEAGEHGQSQSITLAAFADKWMKEYAEKNLKKATISMYRGTIKRYIKDSIGVNQLGKVKVLQVQQWLNYLQDEKQISQKTIRNSFFLLNNIFQYAMKWSYVKSNPCELATLSARNRKEAGYYTNDEVITLLDKLASLPKEKLYLRIGIMLTLFTGMRKGELMGLTWEDVDFDACTLSINKTRQYTPDFGSYTDTPKTRTSVRTVSFPPECADLLRKLRLQQEERRLAIGNKWEGSEFIFLNDFGSPMCANGFSKLFKSFLESSELRVITFHQLRHTHASLLRYLNVDEMQISRRLGHSDLSTTRNIYTHLFANTDQSVSEKISETFLKNKAAK